MRFRYATTEDAPVLATLNHRLIQDERHRNPMGSAELEVRMRGWLNNEYEAVLFDQDDQPVGYALYRRDPEWVYLRQFFIDRSCRRRGLGRAAMSWLREHAWRDQPRIRLEVLVGNVAAIAFWREIGFHDYCLTMELDNTDHDAV